MHTRPHAVATGAAEHDRTGPERDRAVITHRAGSFYARVGKPVMDRAFAVVMLVLLVPVLLVVAAAVFVSVGNPVILRQQRVGRDGRHFTVFKFRSMRPDRRLGRTGFDGTDRRQTHKSESDPRLTPTGRVLRRYSLDELPQLVNVVRGDMSLVGPRPELPAVVEAHYVGWQHRRHAVKPGMTGLWQVSGRGHGLMHEHVDIDLDYVGRMSFAHDLSILARTIPAALSTHRGF